jgi:hypothetical protein
MMFVPFFGLEAHVEAPTAGLLVILAGVSKIGNLRIYY